MAAEYEPKEKKEDENRINNNNNNISLQPMHEMEMTTNPFFKQQSHLPPDLQKYITNDHELQHDSIQEQNHHNMKIDSKWNRHDSLYIFLSLILSISIYVLCTFYSVIFSESNLYFNAILNCLLLLTMQMFIFVPINMHVYKYYLEYKSAHRKTIHKIRESYGVFRIKYPIKTFIVFFMIVIIVNTLEPPVGNNTKQIDYRFERNNYSQCKIFPNRLEDKFLNVDGVRNGKAYLYKRPKSMENFTTIYEFPRALAAGFRDVVTFLPDMTTECKKLITQRVMLSIFRPCSPVCSDTNYFCSDYCEYERSVCPDFFNNLDNIGELESLLISSQYTNAEKQLAKQLLQLTFDSECPEEKGSTLYCPNPTKQRRDDWAKNLIEFASMKNGFVKLFTDIPKICKSRDSLKNNNEYCINKEVYSVNQNLLATKDNTKIPCDMDQFIIDYENGNKGKGSIATHSSFPKSETRQEIQFRFNIATIAAVVTSHFMILFQNMKRKKSFLYAKQEMGKNSKFNLSLFHLLILASFSIVLTFYLYILSELMGDILTTLGYQAGVGPLLINPLPTLIMTFVIFALLWKTMDILHHIICVRKGINRINQTLRNKASSNNMMKRLLDLYKALVGIRNGKYYLLKAVAWEIIEYVVQLSSLVQFGPTKHVDYV